MPLQNGIHSIIHTAAAANLSAFTYTDVYAGAGASPVINGITVVMAAGSLLPVLVTSISPTANVFVLGDKKTTSDPGGITGVTY